MGIEDSSSEEGEISNIFIVFVNGKKVEDHSIDPEWTLLHYLRYKLCLVGTKMCCGEGGCGACTVMISKHSHRLKITKHYTVNACLTPLASVHGMAVTTVEGIGSIKKGLHVVQERIAKAHGTQCGFCTPGMVMSMYTLLRNNPVPSMKEIQEYLTGNLCRCTGYRPILDGFGTFSGERTKGCGKSNCCQLQNQNTDSVSQMVRSTSCTQKDMKAKDGVTDGLFDPAELTPYDRSQEIIFPPELKMSDQLEFQTLQFRGPRVTYWRPKSLSHLIQLKHQHPQAKIIVGNTEVGIEVKFKNQVYPVLINSSQIPELTCVEILNTGLQIGSALSLTDLQVKLKEVVNTLPECKTRSLTAMLEMLQWFAGKQIRNVACLGGNIMTSSPVSDLNPVLVAAGATLTFSNLDAADRKVLMDDNFFVGYRKNSASPSEVLISIHIPFTEKEEVIHTYKQSRRRDDDTAIVNAAMKVKFHPGTCVISNIVLAYGAMAPTTIMAKNTMKELQGQSWDASLLEKGISLLSEELTLPPSAPGGMVQYRQTLVLSFFFKFYLSVCQWLNAEVPNSVPPLQEDELSAIESFDIPYAASSQVFKAGDGRNDPVGRPLVHSSAYKAATGEALYADDIKNLPDDLHAAFVISSRAHAIITHIDATEASQVEGVEAFFSAKDLPGDRNICGVILDEEVFRRERVQCIGQIIGLVVANDQLTAREAAKLVKIQYEDLPSPIFTIEDAIKENSWWGPFTISKGSLEEGFAQASHILKGEMYMGGQQHFYLEPNSHIAIPKGEDEEIELITTSQHLAGAQQQVAKALGITANKVLVRVKRVGGAFGGKEMQPTFFSVPVAVAASKLNRVVRTTLIQQENMAITGGRQPFLCRWEVGVTNEGHLTALKVTLYANGGCAMDMSVAIVKKCMTSIDNAYRNSNIEVTGHSCKTNLTSNTAFRGFGAPQAVMFMEDIMSRVAAYIGVPPQMVREQNLYRTGDLTHINYKLENCTVRRCWTQVIQQAQVETRTHVIRRFNMKNRYRKRGLAAVPLKYGIGLQNPMSQGGALVHIYTDGSVLISHGGIELGQGLHTKILQVAACALSIAVENIHISDTATDKVPNATPTVGSISSDLYGMAVVNASQELIKRLEPYRKKAPQATWKDWVKSAHMDLVSLSCIGFHALVGLSDYDFETHSGNPFRYCSQGAAVSEVEIDCLTGDHTLLRTDIVMDVGKSLNPAIDVGQIEGGFVQGVGLVTLEELVYSSEGALITKGPGAYKIPGVQDIPRELHVSLLQDSDNPQAVYSSKAVGEPPLVLATSVFQALKAAIGSAREDQGLNPVFRLDSPATAERIRLACQDSFTQRVLQK